jgi:hypothetical protein
MLVNYLSWVDVATPTVEDCNNQDKIKPLHIKMRDLTLTRTRRLGLGRP